MKLFYYKQLINKSINKLINKTMALNMNINMFGWFLQCRLPFYQLNKRIIDMHWYDDETNKSSIVIKMLLVRQDKKMILFMYDDYIHFNDDDDIDEIVAKNGFKKHTGKETFDFICNKYAEISNMLDFRNFVCLYTNNIYYSDCYDSFLLK